MAEKENHVGGYGAVRVNASPMSLPGHGQNFFNGARGTMPLKSPSAHIMAPRAAFSPVIANLQKETHDSHTPVVPHPFKQIGHIADLQAPDQPPVVPVQLQVSDKTPLKAPIVRIVGSSQKRSRRSSEGESVESLRSQLEEERTEQANMRKRVADLITKTLSKSMLKEKGLESSGASSDRNYFALVELLNAVKQDRAREQRESQEQIDFLEAQLEQLQTKQEEDFNKRASTSPQTDRFSPQQITRTGTLQCDTCNDTTADLRKAKNELTEALNLVDARNLQIKELTSKLSTTEQSNSRLTQENRRLTMDLSTDEKGMQSMYALQNDLIQEIQKQKSAIAKLHASRAELEKKISTMTHDHDAESKDLRLQIKTLQDQAAAMPTQGPSSHLLKDENTRLEAEVKRLRQQNSEQAATFDKQMASVTNQVSGIRDKYHKVRDENFAVAGKQVELDKVTLTLNKERLDFDQKMGRMHQEKAQAEEMLTRMQQTHLRMEAHIRQLQQEKQQVLAQAQQEKAGAEAENDKLALQLRELELARRNVKELEAARTTIHAQILDLQNARTDHAQLASKLAAKESACQQLAQQVEALEAEVKRSKEAPPAEKVIIAAEVKVIKTVPGTSLTWKTPSAPSAPALDTGSCMAEIALAEAGGRKRAQQTSRQNLSFFSGSAPPMTTPACAMSAAPAPALIKAAEVAAPETPSTDFGDKRAPHLEDLEDMLPLSQGVGCGLRAAPTVQAAPPRLLTPPKAAAEGEEGEGEEEGKRVGGVNLYRAELSQEKEEPAAAGAEALAASWEVGMQNVELTADGKIVPVKTALPTLTEDPIAELGSPAPPTQPMPKGSGRFDALTAGKGGPPVVTATLGVLGAGNGGVLGMQM